VNCFLCLDTGREESEHLQQVVILLGYTRYFDNGGLVSPKKQHTQWQGRGGWYEYILPSPALTVAALPVKCRSYTKSKSASQPIPLTYDALWVLQVSALLYSTARTTPARLTARAITCLQARARHLLHCCCATSISYHKHRKNKVYF
jgi:hypothetical protein